MMFSAREISFLLRWYFSEDRGRFNCVKYSQGVFNGELSYFTGSEDIEIRSSLTGERAFLSFPFTVTCILN
jgi:hypothetical protein